MPVCCVVKERKHVSAPCKQLVPLSLSTVQLIWRSIALKSAQHHSPSPPVKHVKNDHLLLKLGIGMQVIIDN